MPRIANAVVPAKAGTQSVNLPFKIWSKAWIPAFAGMTILAVFLFSDSLHAAWEEPPKISTEPIGSPFFRHLAAETNIDLRELVKFEKHGFGRTEVCTLIVISSSTGVPIREYGKRRIKEKVSLRQLAMDASLDFDAVYAKAHVLKEKVEALGDQNLPPPLYEIPSPTPTPDAPKKKDKSKKEKQPAAASTPAPQSTPTTGDKPSELD